MPIYDYRCTSCGLKKEVMRKISDEQLTTCPECGKETFAKQVSAAGFQLKGSGWYATDFKGGSKPKEESAPASTPCGGNCACH
jgi:putative FmdB family regulatory protein